MKLCMKHQRFKLIIFCSNDNPVLILTYLQQGHILQLRVLYEKNVTMMDTLEIIAFCDLEFGLLCILKGL